MERGNWYLSTWFISFLFTLWFLVVPLIIGIILLKQQSKNNVIFYNNLVANTKSKERELQMKEDDLCTKEKLLIESKAEKERHIKELESRHLEKLKLLTRDREIDLKTREVAINKKEKSWEDRLTAKQRELALKELIHTIKVTALVKEKLQKISELEITLINEEKALNQKILKKKKELCLIELAHRLRFLSNKRSIELELVNHQNKMKAIVNEKHEELALLEQVHIQNLEDLTKEKKLQLEEKEKDLKLREQDVVIKIQEKRNELGNLELAHLKKLDALTKAKDEALLLREKDVEEKERELKGAQQEMQLINQKITLMKQQVISLEDELLYQSFGFYETRFDLESSIEYKGYLQLVRDKQKELVKNKMAVVSHIGANHKQTKSTNQFNKCIKFAIRTFNNECDAVINKVKFYNVDVCEKRIRTAFYEINSLNMYNSFELAEDYLNLKLEELFLAYEYSQKKQEEKEEQRRIRELMREEQEAERQLQEELKVLEKEKQHLENAMIHASQFSEEKVNELKGRLDEIEHQIADVDYRVKNTKAGYVYVISNIGSFGENIYKIGMTRRLEPIDRVKELSGASVPFRYDVHAMIFSEDAPQLEASLHRTFSHRRVNKINERKEFFNVSLEEIKRVAKENHNAIIEFTMLAEAQEYRETLSINKKIAKQYII
ncbi:DUF4041 domain-containing protein [Anaerobacillus arseniciselenatis]|uniref:DUF4041 domain-containing protein n=1 Tax=Anaerobacillus arseniciselenatis TaxID=85682 RepID=UPI0014711A29|nr:DUF4041 domain-containing protein [Anaerobacillus arseniciselenatis]